PSGQAKPRPGPPSRCTGEPPCVPAQHLFYRSNACRQTEALERAVHILPSQFEAWKKRNSCCCGNIRHGVALLCGFVTPSLAAQGGQRLLPISTFSGAISGSIPSKRSRTVDRTRMSNMARKKHL